MTSKVGSDIRSPLGRPAKVTFSATHVVAIHIRGEPHPDKTKMYVPIDDGKLLQLMTWCREQELYPRMPSGHTGGGSHLGFYDPKDAERVVEKCRELGLVEMGFDEQP